MQSVAGWNNGDTVVAVGGVFMSIRTLPCWPMRQVSSQAKFAIVIIRLERIAAWQRQFLKPSGAGGMEVKSSSVIVPPSAGTGRILLH